MGEQSRERINQYFKIVQRFRLQRRLNGMYTDDFQIFMIPQSINLFLSFLITYFGIVIFEKFQVVFTILSINAWYLYIYWMGKGWEEDGKRTGRGWEEDGKKMGRGWEEDGEEDGKKMRRGWKEDGKRMGRGWEENGKRMGRRWGRGWEEDWKRMGRGWEEDEKRMGRGWEEGCEEWMEDRLEYEGLKRG